MIWLKILKLYFSFDDSKPYLIYELAETKSPKAIKYIEKLLYNKKRLIRENAAGALTSIKWNTEDPELLAQHYVSSYKWDNAAKLGSHSVKALIILIGSTYNYQKYSNPRFTEEEIRKLAFDTIKKIGEESVYPLVELISEGNDSLTRTSVAFALGEIGSIKAYETLSKAIWDKEYLVRDEAVTALGKLKNIDAIEPLIKVFHEIPGTEKSVIEAIGYLKDDKSYQFLIKLLNEKNSFKEKVISSLGRLGDKRAVKYLIPYLKDQNIEIKKETVRILGILEDNNSIEPLLELLDENDYFLLELVIKSLEKIGWTPVDDKQNAIVSIVKKEWYKASEFGILALKPLLISHYEDRWGSKKIDENKGGPLRALLKICKDNPEGVINYLENINDNLVKSAIYLLGESGNSIAVTQLLKILNDENTYFIIKELVIEALGKIKDKKAIEPLLITLRKKSTNISRGYIFQALCSIGEISQLPEQVSFIKNGPDDISCSISRAITGFETLLETSPEKISIENLKLINNIKNNYHYTTGAFHGQAFMTYDCTRIKELAQKELKKR